MWLICTLFRIRRVISNGREMWLLTLNQNFMKIKGIIKIQAYIFLFDKCFSICVHIFSAALVHSYVTVVCIKGSAAMFRKLKGWVKYKFTTFHLIEAIFGVLQDVSTINVNM